MKPFPRILKRLAVISVVFVAVLGLNSCDRYAMFSNISLSMPDDMHLEIGVCESSTVDRMFISYIEYPSREWIRVYEARGEAFTVLAGETVLLDQSPFGFMPQVSGHLRLNAGDEVNIVVDGVDDQPTLRGMFRIPKTRLREGEWLLPDGSISAKMCENTK